MEIEALKKILENEVYRATLDLISNKTNIGINNHTNHAILNIGLKTLNASSLDEANIYESLVNNNSLLVKYCTIRINGFKNVGIEQEYAKGEEPSADDFDEEVENESLSIISLLGFVIEFHFLSNSNSMGLSNYLKKIRLPKAEKHKMEIQSFFNLARNS